MRALKFILQIFIFIGLKLKETIFHPKLWNDILHFIGCILVIIVVFILLGGVFWTIGWCSHFFVDGNYWLNEEFNGEWTHNNYITLGGMLLLLGFFMGIPIFGIVTGIMWLHLNFNRFIPFIKSNWKQAQEIADRYLDKE